MPILLNSSVPTAFFRASSFVECAKGTKILKKVFSFISHEIPFEMESKTVYSSKLAPIEQKESNFEILLFKIQKQPIIWPIQWDY